MASPFFPNHHIPLSLLYLPNFWPQDLWVSCVLPSSLFCTAEQSRNGCSTHQAKYVYVNCGFWGLVSWGAPDGLLRVNGGSWCELPFTLGFWGFISQGVLDGLLRVDGSPWCELSPLTFFVCSIHAAKSFFLLSFILFKTDFSFLLYSDPSFCSK